MVIATVVVMIAVQEVVTAVAAQLAKPSKHAQRKVKEGGRARAKEGGRARAMHTGTS
jgi:hypothetical protein